MALQKSGAWPLAGSGKSFEPSVVALLGKFQVPCALADKSRKLASSGKARRLSVAKRSSGRAPGVVGDCYFCSSAIWRFPERNIVVQPQAKIDHLDVSHRR